MKEMFLKLGKDAAEDVLTGTNIQDAVAKIAKENSLNDEQIKRLCAQTNHALERQTTQSFKQATPEDRGSYQNWEIADAEKVKQLIMPSKPEAKAASINYSCYDKSPKENKTIEKLSKTASDKDDDVEIVRFNNIIVPHADSFQYEATKLASNRKMYIEKISSMINGSSVQYEQLLKGFLRLIEESLHSGNELNGLRLYIKSAMGMGDEEFGYFWNEVEAHLKTKGLIERSDLGENRYEAQEVLQASRDPRVDPAIFKNATDMASHMTHMSKLTNELSELTKEAAYLDLLNVIFENIPTFDKTASENSLYENTMTVFNNTINEENMPLVVKEAIAQKIEGGGYNPSSMNKVKDSAKSGLKGNGLTLAMLGTGLFDPAMKALSTRRIYGA